MDGRLLFVTGMLCHAIQDLETAGILYARLAKQGPEWHQAKILLAQIYREKGMALEPVDKEAAITAYLEAFTRYQDLALAPWSELKTWDLADFIKKNYGLHLLTTIVEEGFWLQRRLEQLGTSIRLNLPDGFEASADQIPADLRVLTWWDDENASLKLRIQESAAATHQPERFPTLAGVPIQNKAPGPEGYRLENAPAGDYHLQATFFGARFSRLLGPIHAITEIWTRYGYPDEMRHLHITRIDSPGSDSFTSLVSPMPLPGPSR